MVTALVREAIQNTVSGVIGAGVIQTANPGGGFDDHLAGGQTRGCDEPDRGARGDGAVEGWRLDLMNWHVIPA